MWLDNKDRKFKEVLVTQCKEGHPENKVAEVWIIEDMDDGRRKLTQYAFSKASDIIAVEKLVQYQELREEPGMVTEKDMDDMFKRVAGAVRAQDFAREVGLNIVTESEALALLTVNTWVNKEKISGLDAARRRAF